MSPMSDTEFQHRKKAQGHVAIATSTLGLGSLGALGAGAATQRVGAARKLPKLMKQGRKLKKLAGTGSIAAGGIGGVGGYNYAAISREEGRRATLKKSFDAEAARHKRNERQVKATGYGGLAALGGSAALGFNSNKARRNARAETARNADLFENTRVSDGYVMEDKIGNKSVVQSPRQGAKERLRPLSPDEAKDFTRSAGAKGRHLKSVARLKTRGAIGLAGLGLAGLVASDRIDSYRKDKGKSYSPRYKRSE